MHINEQRFLDNLAMLAQIGLDPLGGLTRVGFSPAEKAAQEWLIRQLDKLNIKHYQDCIGNVFGEIPGESGQYITIGSHLDTVPQGGAYDGSLGVVAGLECLARLVELETPLVHGVRLAAFCGEEGGAVGGTFGSRCYSGTASHVKEADLQAVGLTTADVLSAKVDPHELLCYLELHIEQGAVLDDASEDIGVVTGIVGIQRYAVTVIGRANHAGTTPMNLRDDALRQAIATMETFYQLVDERQAHMVGTIGKMQILPGAVNVIPGEVRYIIEMRAMDLSYAEEVAQCLTEKYLQKSVNIEKIVDKGSVQMDSGMMQTIEAAVLKTGYSYRLMPSGAGHDANPMAHITPTGMIFVPSVKGISHAPDEFTDANDLVKGATVLLETVYLLNK